MTIDPVHGIVWQHIRYSRAARALKNVSGGVQTNRWNVFQIEVIGRANKVPFHPVMAKVAQWLQHDHGVPLTEHVGWKPYDASYGLHNGVRLSGTAWNEYSGHLGHMHAPENDHGDPGWPFPLDKILLVQTPEVDVPLTSEDIKAVAEATAAKLDPKLPRLINSGDPAQSMGPYSLKTLQESLDRIEKLLESLVPPATT
jgi:hypothetical protein